MKENNSTIEPWLQKMNKELVKEVSGFNRFLSTKFEEMNHNKYEDSQVSLKLEQLLRWEAVAKSILSVQHLGDNFVDAFNLNNEPFVLLNLSKGTVLILKDTEMLEVFNESKEQQTVATGFLLKKCLRKVRTTHESRDIFTAVRVEVDLVYNSIVYESNEPFIVKRVGKIEGKSKFNDRLRREFKVQSLLTQLQHSALNNLVAYCEDRHSMFAISKSAGNIDLLDSLQEQIKVNGSSFKETTIKTMFKQAIEGLVVAHNLGIAHRDLSLENLVVNRDKLEIIDWGHSCSTSLDGLMKHEGIIGKERYFSPELLTKTERYDPFKSDVFSIGVCLFSSLTGQMPFSSLSDDRAKVLSKGVKVLLTALKIELSEEALSLLEGCLEWEVEKRFNMSEVLDHRFFA